MSGLPFWDADDPDEAAAWDTVVINGRKLPGLAAVEGEIGRKIDARSPPGSDGARLIHRGYEPAKVKITLRLWTREHWRDWQAVYPRRRPGERIQPLEVSHPALVVLGVRNVFVEKVGAPRPGTPKGVMEVAIHAVEHRPPTRTNVTTTPRRDPNAGALERLPVAGEQPPAVQNPPSASNNGP